VWGGNDPVYSVWFRLCGSCVFYECNISGKWSKMENKGKSVRTIFIQKQIRFNASKTFSNYSSMLANLKII
jgi:hypothetical protein